MKKKSIPLYVVVTLSVSASVMMMYSAVKILILRTQTNEDLENAKYNSLYDIKTKQLPNVTVAVAVISIFQSLIVLGVTLYSVCNSNLSFVEKIKKPFANALKKKKPPEKPIKKITKAVPEKPLVIKPPIVVPQDNNPV